MPGRWNRGPGSGWAMPADKHGSAPPSMGSVPASNPGPCWQPHSTEARGSAPSSCLMPTEHSRTPWDSWVPLCYRHPGSVWVVGQNYKLENKTSVPTPSPSSGECPPPHCQSWPPDILLLNPPLFSAQKNDTESNKSTKSTWRGWRWPRASSTSQPDSATWCL